MKEAKFSRLYWVPGAGGSAKKVVMSYANYFDVRITPSRKLTYDPGIMKPALPLSGQGQICAICVPALTTSANTKGEKS
jgi:hypothetical protein